MQVTYQEFETEFNAYYRFDKYFNYVLVCSFIVFGVLCFFKLAADELNFTAETRYMVAFVALFLIAAGILGLVTLKRKYKLVRYENSLSTSQNIELINEIKAMLNNNERAGSINFLKFMFWRGWWKTSCFIFLFADENYISFNIESLRGLIDFGADQKRQEMIIELLTKLSINHK